MSKALKIGCGGEDFVEVEKLHWFQEKLKTITEQAFFELKESLKTHGIKNPFVVWNDGKKLNLQDGHHRMLALKELKSEGWTIPPLPVNYSKDATKKEAAQSILVLNSRYAKINEDSLSNYVIDFGLKTDDLKFLDIPDIPMDYFKADDSLAAITSPEEMRRDLEKEDRDYLRNEEKTTEQIDVMNPNENVKIEDIKEEKMDVVGRRYVIIIDCRDQAQKEELKELLHPIVDGSGAKFF